VLSRDNDGVDTLRNGLAIDVLVLYGDLGLGVRSQPTASSVTAALGDLLGEFSGQDVSQGHKLRGLVGSITKHVSLISSTEVFVRPSDVYSSGNVRGLLFDANHDIAALPVETFITVVEANILDSVTDDGLVVRMSGGGDLTKDHHHPSLGGGL
jgi:hypothetical protein